MSQSRKNRQPKKSSLSGNYRKRRPMQVQQLEVRWAMHGGEEHEDPEDESGIVGEPWLEHLISDTDAFDATAGNEPTPNLIQAAAVVGAAAADVGEWGPVESAQINFINALMLPTGKVLGYDRTLNMRLWDPVTNEFSEPANPGYNFFCTGTSLLADGTVLMTGGAVVDYVGLPYAAIYNPFTDTWSQLGNMSGGRWYPSSTTLANGDALILSGNTNGAVVNPLPQVYDSKTGTWRDLTGAVQALPVYPRTFSAPNGDAFVAGPQAFTQYIDTSGIGEIIPVGYRVTPDRYYGSAVMYAPGKILYVGGGVGDNSAEVIDLNDPNPEWRAVAPMEFGRRNCNATLLPNGEVLIIGGNSGGGNYDGDAVMAAEIWDPVTETFRTVANMGDVRWYHSTALLLPDGRVLSSGGDLHLTKQVYSPPYMFEGARPTISSAPGTVDYGDSFFVGTPDAANITGARWIRLGTATHAQNWDQYESSATFTKTAGGLMVSAPPVPDSSPPGYYYLSILKGDVPSESKIIRIGDPPKVSISGTTVTEASTGNTAVAQFTVTLSESSAKTITVNYTTANDTAIAGQDYTATSGTLTFAPGVTTQIISVPITGDGVVDLNEMFTVNLSAPTNAAVGVGIGQGLIRDFSSLPVLQIKGTKLTEGNAGSQVASFVVSLSTASATPVTVQYTTVDGSAKAGSDYTAKAGTLTFAPGVTTQTITVNVLGDNTDEWNENFDVVLSNPTGATIEIGDAEALIYNNDAPVYANMVAAATINEPAAGQTATLNVTASLSQASGKPVKLHWTTIQDGSAVAGRNYVDAIGMVTFAPGETTKTFTITVMGDGVKRANGTLSVFMQGELGNANFGVRNSDITIIETNTVPSISLSAGTTTEGNSGTKNMVFTATLSAPTAQQVSVTYTTSAGTATATTDYTQATGTIVFAPNTTTKTFNVVIRGDTTVESNETFNVVLSNPINATIDTVRTVGVIVDNDGGDVPATPANPSTTAGYGSATIKWDSVAGATSYRIYRGTNVNGEGTTPIAIAVTDTSYTDTGLTNGTRYYYKVTAVKGTFEGSFSAEVFATPNSYNFADGFVGKYSVNDVVYSNDVNVNLLSLNGLNIENLRLAGESLQLTDGGTNQTNSVFTRNRVNVTRFNTQFTFQQLPSYLYTDPLGEGLTFTLQGVDPTVMGAAGSGLGYAGIKKSVAIKFDLTDSAGEGNNSTGLYNGGAQPTSANSVNLNGTGIDLHSNHPFSVNMSYDGTTLQVTLTDTVTLASATQNYTVNIPALIGSNTAFVGFTGSTGQRTAIQKINNWVFTPAPSAPGNLQLNGSTATQVSLAWANTDPNATGVLIERKTTLIGAYTQIGTVASTATTFVDTTAVAGTTYYYRVRSTTNGTTSFYSNEIRATVGVTGTAPAAPTGLAVNSSSGTHVSLNWASAPANSTSVLIERKTGVAGTYAPIGSAANPATAFVDANVAANTTYYYRVRATNGLNSGYSNEVNVTTGNAIGQSLDYAAGFAGAESQFTFNGPWPPSIVGNSLQLTGDALSAVATIFAVTPVNVQTFRTQFSFTQLGGTDPTADGMTFTIQGAGPEALGGGGGGLGFAGIPKSVAIKFDLFSNAGEGDSSTGLYINGAAPTSANSTSLAGTGINLHSGHTFNVTMVYDGTTLTVTITDATTLATYTKAYTVNIPNIVSGNTAYVGFTGSTGGLTAIQQIKNWTYTNSIAPAAPTAPAGLAVSGSTPSQVSLSWTNTDPTSTSVLIERKTGVGGTYAQIGTAVYPATTYVDNTAAAGTTYYYRVRATNGTLNSTYSNEVNVTTGTVPTPPTAPTGLQVTGFSAIQVSLGWTNTDPTATSVLIERKTGVGGTYAQIGTAASPAATFVDTTVAASTTYYYRVRATNGTLNSGYANEVNVTTAAAPTPPTAPTGLAVSASSATQVSLGWTNTDPTSTSVLIERKTGLDGTYTQIGTAANPAITFVDNTVAASTTYYYRVRATNGTLNSTYSNEVNVTTDAVATPALNFPAGFAGAASQFAFNGVTPASIIGSALQITGANLNTVASAFALTPVNVQTFNTQFSITQLAGTTPTADGMTFIISGVGPNVLGGGGGGLGFTGTTKSVAIKFDLYNNSGEGDSSTGLYTNGAAPNNVNSVSLAGSGIDLHSGHTFNVSMSYNGTTLTVTITDATTLAAFTRAYTVNIPTIVGGNMAYVGFTASTGGYSAVQRVLNWTFSSTTAPTAPTAPTGLAVTGSTATQVSLGWTNTDPTSTSVLIERKTGVGGTYAQIGTAASPAATFIDTTTAASTTYYYRVRASNGTLNSTYSNEVNVTTPAVPTPPTAPTGLAVTSSTGNQVNLGWTNTDPTSTSVLIERKTGVGGTYAQIGTAASPAATFVDNTVAASTTYYYRVRATNGTLNSTYSNEVNVTTGTVATPTLNFPTGFTGAASQFAFNGVTPASIIGSALQITGANLNTVASAFALTPVNVQTFNTQFSITQLAGTTPTADGMTFMISGVSPNVLGGGGGGLGFTGTTKSVAIKFDLYNNAGEGASSTGIYTNGAAPNNVNSVSLAGSGIDLHSGHTFNVSMVYDGTTLTVTITDATTLAAFTRAYTINIPTIVGANTAYVGFTGSTGGYSAVQRVLNWTYASGTGAAPSAVVENQAPSADANLDGFVDGTDYNYWADSLGKTSSDGSLLTGDFNRDGAVDGADYVLWADTYSPRPAAAPAASAPVPAAAALPTLAESDISQSSSSQSNSIAETAVTLVTSTPVTAAAASVPVVNAGQTPLATRIQQLLAAKENIRSTAVDSVLANEDRMASLVAAIRSGSLRHELRVGELSASLEQQLDELFENTAWMRRLTRRGK